MPIQIYNSLTRKKEEFIPLKDKQVKIYVCGPTVYDQPHIGHARSAYIFDVIRRYLVYKGYRVKFARNVTDVDDKIIEKARNEYKGEDLNSAFKKVAAQYLDSYHNALNNLGIPTGKPEIIEPKASEYISKMIVFISDLIKKGIAYQAGGDVYFDISKAKNYGKLSNQSPDKMEVGARVASGENKRNPLDFALWKAAKEGEPSWDSPWGKGRPGWHIECSVMSSDILGDEFDIHGGGIDLIFPHHENEIAQSEGAGKKFAKIWIHHGLLTINGQKMAKSLGNFITIKDFIDRYKNADYLKLFFLFTHYSHPIDYTDEKIEETKQALERILILLNKIERVTRPSLDLVRLRSPQVARDRQGCKATNKSIKEIEEIKNNFIAAMDDDFNMPQALAAIFELVTLTNKRFDDQDFIYSAKVVLEEIFSIFNLTLKMTSKSSTISAGAYIIAEEESINLKIQERNNARKNKDYALSDKIREELEEKGIILEDTKGGKTTWRRRP